MKKIFFFSIISFGAFQLNAQVFVDTLPQNKNALIEEFTGVQCGGCTYGHQEVQALLNTYPNRVFAASMHSANIGHTEPYGSDPNLARVFPDQLYSQIPDLSSIPAGIISRGYFDGSLSHIFMPFSPYHEAIDSAINQILNEPSPLNIGVEAVYDSVTKQLNIHVQAYTTASCNGNYNLSVYFTESNILTSQWNGSAILTNYSQKHVFREILSPTWGESIITGFQSAGVLIDKYYSFDNTSALYNMQNVEVIALVSASGSAFGDIVQVMGAEPSLTGQVITAVKEVGLKPFSIYPNPLSEIQQLIQIRGVYASDKLRIHNVQGKLLFEVNVNPSTKSLELNLEPGIYSVSLKSNIQTTQKLIVY